MSATDKVALAAKSPADIRRDLFPTFDSMKESMSGAALEKVTQLDQETGLDPANAALPAQFKTEVHNAWVTGAVDAGSFEDVFNRFVMANAGKYTYKGKAIDAAGFQTACPNDASLSRGVGFHKFTKDVLDIAGAIQEMQATGAAGGGGGAAAPGGGAPPAAAAGPPGPDEAHKYVLDKIKAQPTSIRRWVTNGDALVQYPGWFFPEPQIRSDAVFSEYIDMLALFANWFPQGIVRMTLLRDKVMQKVTAGGLRKPTVFDGLMSPLWMQRDNRDKNWGKTAGGVREALLQCAWADVDHAKWQVAGEDGAYAAVTAAARAQAEARRAGTQNPAANATVAAHEQQQVGNAQTAQAAQRAEDAAAGGGPPSGGGGAGGGGTPGSGGAPAGGATTGAGPRRAE
jgi:hypothetical protein